MMATFFIVLGIGFLLILLHIMQINAPAESWPPELIVNPLWAYGLATAGFIGMACVKIFE